MKKPEENNKSNEQDSKSKHNFSDVFRAFSLVSQLGFSMAACIIFCIWGGNLLDNKLGTSPWLLILGALLGAASSFKVMFDMLNKHWRNK